MFLRSYCRINAYIAILALCEIHLGYIWVKEKRERGKNNLPYQFEKRYISQLLATENIE